MAAFGRAYPFLCGANQIVNGRFGGRWLFEGDGEHWVRCKGGEVLVDLDDYVGRSVYFTGDLDPKISGLCRAALREGDSALDIGGHVGLLTMAMAETIGEAGEVNVFEPNPVLRARIVEAVSRRGLEQVVCHGYALSDREAQLSLRVPNGNSGAASIRRHQALGGCQEFVVETRRLDSVVGGFKKPPVVLKIDAEGAEAEVLRGGASFFSETPPMVVVFESNPDPETGRVDEEPFAFLRAAGYRVFAVQKTLFHLGLTESSSPESGHDFVALHGGKRFNEVLERFGGRVSLRSGDGRRIR